MERPLLNVHEVAERYGVSVRTVWRLVDRAAIAAPIRLRGGSRITRWRLADLLEAERAYAAV